MKKFIPFLFLITSVSFADVVDEHLKAQVKEHSIHGNPIFMGDFAKVGPDGRASIYKIPKCTDPECMFDFNSNYNVGTDELFTCSPPPSARIIYTDRNHAYLFFEGCSLTLNMKAPNALEVTTISCKARKVGDCETKDMIGIYERLGRPSFDCGVLTPYNELTPARKTICHDLELSKIDAEVDELFEKIDGKEPHELENKFIRDRDACGPKVECIKALLSKRRQEILLFKPAQNK
jgi:hypothetical protein